MSDAMWIALFAALPGILTSVGMIFQIRRVHVLVNSQKDALTRLLREALGTIERMEIVDRSQTQTIAQLRDTLNTGGTTRARPPSLHTGVPPDEAR